MDMLEKRKAELGVASMRKPLVEGGINLKPKAAEGLQALLFEPSSIEQGKE